MEDNGKLFENISLVILSIINNLTYLKHIEKEISWTKGDNGKLYYYIQLSMTHTLSPDKQKNDVLR